MFNLENQIPKLCHLAQEMGEKEKICILHAAGLQALSSMVFVSLVMPCGLLGVLLFGSRLAFPALCIH